MSDDYATLRQWTDVVRRARLGRTVKAVALVLATYADADGTRVYPGVARLSYDAEVNYNTAKGALKALRDAGLIRKVGRRGDADVYRLVLAPDLSDRCDVPTPAQVDLELAAIRGLKRGSYVPKQRDEDEDLRPVDVAADGTGSEDLRPVSRAADSDICGPFDRPQEKSAVCLTNNLRPVDVAATTQDRDTKETTHSDTDVRTVSHPPHGVAAESNSDLPSADVIDLEARRTTLAPTRCAHGLKGGKRADGQPHCAICRNVPAIAEAFIPGPRGAPA